MNERRRFDGVEPVRPPDSFPVVRTRLAKNNFFSRTLSRNRGVGAGRWGWEDYSVIQRHGERNTRANNFREIRVSLLRNKYNNVRPAIDRGEQLNEKRSRRENSFRKKLIFFKKNMCIYIRKIERKIKRQT